MPSSSDSTSTNPDDNSFEGPDVEISLDSPEPDSLGTGPTVAHQPGEGAADTP